MVTSRSKSPIQRQTNPRKRDQRTDPSRNSPKEIRQPCNQQWANWWRNMSPWLHIKKNLLAACPSYQGSTVNQRWEIVKQNKRCRKCLRAPHHTNDCRKPDGTSCDKCKKNHHRTLHNEKKDPLSYNLSSNALPFSSQEDAIIADSNSNRHKEDSPSTYGPETVQQCQYSFKKIHWKLSSSGDNPTQVASLRWYRRSSHWYWPCWRICWCSHNVWRVWRAYCEEKLFRMVCHGTIWFKDNEHIWNSVSRRRDGEHRGQCDEASSSRSVGCQTDWTLYMQWQCSSRKLVCKVPIGFNYIGGWKNPSQNALERKSIAKTQQLRHRNQKNVFCWEVIQEKELLRDCEWRSPEVVGPGLCLQSTSWTSGP